MSATNWSNYLLKYKSNSNLTHIAFNNGKYSVSDENYNEFYKKYYNCLMKNDGTLYIIEKINDNPFAFFLDIEVPKNSEAKLKIKTNDIKVLIDKCKECISVIFKQSDKFDINESIITIRNNGKMNKYHINYPNLIVNTKIALYLSKMLINKMGEIDNDLKKIIDISVYRTGFRLFGSKKSEEDIKKEKSVLSKEELENYSSVYEIFNINDVEIYDIKDTSYEMFMKFVIRRKKNILLTSLLKSVEIEKETKETNEKETKKEIEVKSNITPEAEREIKELLKYIKMENSEHLEKYNLEIKNINCTTNKVGTLCYYISLTDKYCPFMCRNHKRSQSPMYIELANNKLFIKCYDQDCLRRRYPDDGFTLPENFEDEYPNLYLSITTKYWKAEVEISSNIRKLLEDSLTGSHYKIAKVIYNIYKDRFRIDDIKNADWYEFDGIRWSKTHIMNILISEELQKYYNGIKINESIDEDLTLSEFVEKEEKVKNNLRNSMVESIINKLENVNFKKNIMTEMHYLFKSLEPNFVSKLDDNPYLIGFKNGIFDLSKNIFREGNPKDYVTLSTGYDYIEYDENIQEVQDIYKFLREIIPNEKVLEYTLKILGHSLSGINDEKFYIFTGLSGANGKSTLMNFLEYTLNDYCSSSDVSMLTNTKALSSSASPDVIRLKGKRLVSFSEPEHNDTLKVGIIKAFSGGDTIIARELYKAPISFKLQASMFLLCNDLPNLSSVDGGIQRRIRVVEFTSRFCDNPVKENEFKIDPTIKTKIKNWRPYFMSILLHNYNLYEKELEENGFVEEPDEVKIATHKYKKDNDKFDEYINESIVASDRHFESMRTIYNNFMQWQASNYPKNKCPEYKELRNALKLKFGEEREKIVNGTKSIGFNVTLNKMDSLMDDIDNE